MKSVFQKLFRLSTVSLASVLAASQAGAVITVNIRADQPAVNQLSKTTYGSGFDYLNADMRVMFTDVFGNGTSTDASPSYTMLKNQNLGMYRFPGGDMSFWYRWDKPCGSVAAPSPQCNEYLSPLDVEKMFIATSGATKRAPLGTPAIFQINTVQSWVTTPDQSTSWKTVYEKTDTYNGTTWVSTPNKQNGLYIVDTATGGGLDQTATVAGNWVTANRSDNSGTTQVEYWEIGNEDWVRWTPEQYATVFKNVVDKMIAANGGTALANGTRKALKLIAQTSPLVQDYTSTDPSHLGINQTAGTNFLSRFATALQNQGFDLGNIYGVAVHPYLDGNKQTALNARVSTMFAKIDDTGNQVQTTLNNIASLGRNWKVLITEYNVLEDVDTNGNTIPAQNKAHAVILADWSANMLAHGVEKLLPHSLASSPRTALFMYRNNGYTLTSPRVMTTGAAFSYLAQSLQGAMYPVDNDSATVNGAKVLSSYAALSGDKNFNVFLVNRDLVNPQLVKLQLTSPTINFKTPGNFAVSTFGDSSTNLATDNYTGNVVWTTPTSTGYVRYCTSSPRTCTISYALGGAINISVPAGGMVHVKVPQE